MADTLAGTKTIGRYTLKAYSKNSTLGYYIKLYDLDVYVKTRSYECPALLYVDGSWVYNYNCQYTSYSIAFDAFLFDEWTYFFDTKPGKNSETVTNKIVLKEGWFDVDPSALYITAFTMLGRYLGYNDSFKYGAAAVLALAEEGIFFSKLKFYYVDSEKHGYIAYPENNEFSTDDSALNRYVDAIDYELYKEDKTTKYSYTFPSYKESVYDTRIQTDCCLLVLCEPTKYKL